MTNTSIKNTHLYKELNWLNQQLMTIDYSTDRQQAILYELGLVRAMLAQLMYNDSNAVTTVKTILKNNPYKRSI